MERRIQLSEDLESRLLELANLLDDKRKTNKEVPQYKTMEDLIVDLVDDVVDVWIDHWRHEP